MNSSNPALPAGEIFNLVSLQDFAPDGSGPLFGIGFDALFQIATPKSPGGIFHTCLDGSGSWTLSLPTGTVPLGLHAEFVSFNLGVLGPDRLSKVAALDF